MNDEQTVIDEYQAALERLKKGQPKRVPKGIRISNDAVAMEAGRRRGSIKRSRPLFGDLILAIKNAAAEQQAPERNQEARVQKWKALARKHQANYEQSLVTELSLLRQVHELKAQLPAKAAKVRDIRSAKSHRR